MQAARRQRVEATARLIVVGDDAAGALAAAIRRLGPTVARRPLAELAPGEGPVLALGIAAADGGVTVRRRIGAEPRLIVVLGRDEVEARLEAFRQGASVIEPSVATETADRVVAALGADPSSELGWVAFGALMEAASARVAERLHTGRAPDLQLRLGDGAAVAAAMDRFADALAELCEGSKARESRPPSRSSSLPPPSSGDVSVEELDWDDDPQTMEADAAEVERFRRLTQSQKAEMIGSLLKGRPAGEIEAPRLWGKSDSEPPARDDHRPMMGARRREPSGVVETVRGRVLQGRPVRSSGIRALARREPATVDVPPNPAPSIELPALPDDDATAAPRPASAEPVSHRERETAVPAARREAKAASAPSSGPAPEADAALPAVLDPDNAQTAPLKPVSAEASEALAARWRSEAKPRLVAETPTLDQALLTPRPRTAVAPAPRASTPPWVWALLLVLTGAGSLAAWLLFGAG